MEGFCRGCLIKYDEPMELLQYTEKNRRLFVYSTGLQVKRNDTFTFQLCKDCYLNMKQACKFKKNCRTSDKRFRNYLALKDVGDPVDFCTFLKNSDETLTFRLPMASGNSTPANQKSRDDDNESTCTSIRNFMTDILQGEEMPDTEARIIKEVIEEEADVLDDSLDSHWLQDDMSIDTDFRLDFSFSQFSTPRTVNDDRCYTPKQKEDQITFDTINTEKQTKILKEFTNAFKTDDNIEELSIFVGGVSENTETYTKLKELTPMGVDEIDGMEKSEMDCLKSEHNLKEVIIDLGIDETEGMDTSDSKIVETDENFKDLSDFGIQDINPVHLSENNKQNKKLCNFGQDRIDGYHNICDKSNKSLKEMISNMEVDAIANSGSLKNYPKIKEFDFGIDQIGKSQINLDMPPLSDDSQREKVDTPDFDAQKVIISSVQSSNEESNSSINIEAFLSIPQRDRIGTPDFEIPKNIVGSIPSNNDVSNSSINIEAFFNAGLEKNKTDSPNFEIAKGGVGSISSNNDASNSIINTEVFFNNRPENDRTDSPDFEIPKRPHSIESANDASNISINIEGLLKSKLVKDRPDTPDFEILKAVRSIQSINENSNSSIKVGAFLKDKLEKAINTPDFEIAKAVRSIQSLNDNSNSSLNIEAFLKDKIEKDRIDTPDFDIPKAVRSIQPINDNSNSSINIEAFLKDKIEKDRIDTPDFDIPKEIRSIQSSNEISNSSTNIEALLKGKPCLIDKKLEEALKNTDNKEFSLDDILISPPVISAASAASTPTITNILFGENLDTTGTHIKIEQYHDVKGDIEIFEEFFQNDTKEFYVDDIKRENEEFKPIELNDIEVANKENDLQNIEMEISIDEKDGAGINVNKAVKISKKEPMIHISQDDENDKFNMKCLYCKLCDIRFDTSRAFSAHFAKKHNIKIVKTRKPNIKKNKEDVIKIKTEATINVFDTPANDKFDLENSYCKLCNKKYDTIRALSVHFTKTHRIKIERPKSVKVVKNHEIVCNICGVKKSRDRSNFAIHVKKCSQKGMIFKCDRCQLDFTTKGRLEKHMSCHTMMKKRKQTGKEFVCTICGAIIHKQSNFALHMRRHAKDYSVKCEICDKGFYRQGDLKVHMRGHTGETEFACKFCPKLFTRRDVLLRHILIHLDEKLYECDYCKKRFIKKFDLKKHIQNESCRSKKKRKAFKKVNDVDIPAEKEQERVVIIKEEIVEIKKEVIEDVTVISAKGSDATLKQQLPFLETERSN